MDHQHLEEEDYSFHLGELFDSYEELESKLEKYSKNSFVHYWRRDSRTVNGAHMKTARPISEKLKYYSVKYACIYGGQKFLPRGAGRRQSQSMRTNCPAHIMLRASKDGTKLEVTSVNNDHNHEISEELFKNLPQERKLCGEIKEEVQDLLQLHIDRKRLKEYVRIRTNKVLRSKDLFNIAAANKEKKEITPERAYQLFKKIHEIEKMPNKIDAESEDEISQTIKRMKTEHRNLCWVQDGMASDLEMTETNDGEDSYTDTLVQDEQSNDVDTAEEQLLNPNDDETIITNGEIVSELVMEDQDPSVIVEPIVNSDGSVFVDDREFNTYCNEHLSEHSKSPSPQVINIETLSPANIEKLSKDLSSQVKTFTAQSIKDQNEIVVPIESTKSWLQSELAKEADDNETDRESISANILKSAKTGKISGVVSSEENENQFLLHEQLTVLRSENTKLQLEIDTLKLKKDKLKLQINCYANEMRKQELEKEKLRLEIKLLQSKVSEDTNDVSHYIFVP